MSPLNCQSKISPKIQLSKISFFSEKDLSCIYNVRLGKSMAAIALSELSECAGIVSHLFMDCQLSTATILLNIRKTTKPCF